MKKIILAVIVTFVSVFVCNSYAYAASTVTLPKVIVSSNKSNSDVFYVSLERLNDTNPMPGSSSINTISIVGNNDNFFGEITYLNNGEYQYRISQSNKNLSNVNYDNTVYNVSVQIKDDKNAIIIKKSGSNEKEDNIIFNNTYTDVKPDDPVVPPTPGDNTDDSSANKKSNSSSPKKTTPVNKINNPYTADTIARYFIVSIISIILILIIIIYINNSKSDD